MTKRITRTGWKLDWTLEGIVGSEWTSDLDVSCMEPDQCVEVANEWLEERRAKSKSSRYDFTVLACDTDADDGNCCSWLCKPFKRKPAKKVIKAKKKAKRSR